MSSLGHVPLPCARHLLWSKEQPARLPCRTPESRAGQWRCGGAGQPHLTTWLALVRADPKNKGGTAQEKGNVFAHGLGRVWLAGHVNANGRQRVMVQDGG